MTTTTLTVPRCTPERFAQDTLTALAERLGPLVDGHGLPAAVDLLCLEVHGRPLHDWLAIAWAAEDARAAELATTVAALREFPRQADETRAARDWHADRLRRLRDVIGDIS